MRLARETAAEESTPEQIPVAIRLLCTAALPAFAVGPSLRTLSIAFAAVRLNRISVDTVRVRARVRLVVVFGSFPRKGLRAPSGTRDKYRVPVGCDRRAGYSGRALTRVLQTVASDKRAADRRFGATHAGHRDPIYRSPSTECGNAGAPETDVRVRVRVYVGSARGCARTVETRGVT